MRKLKIVLTLGVLLFLSAPLFADGRVTLYLIADVFDTKDVIGTVVERRDKSSLRWEKCIKILIFTPSITIDRLTEGREYQFRVILESAYGQGQPSDPTEFYKIGAEPLDGINVWCKPPFPWFSKYVMAKPVENDFMNVLNFEQEPRIPFRR